jgi:hypothetical protein
MSILLSGAATIHLDADACAWESRQRFIPYEEVQKHVSADDCWVIIKVNIGVVSTHLLDS